MKKVITKSVMLIAVSAMMITGYTRSPEPPAVTETAETTAETTETTAGEAAGDSLFVPGTYEGTANGVEIEPDRARSTVTASTTVFNRAGAILTDRNGRRLVNETGPYADIRTNLLLQEDQTLFLVMDQNGFDLFLAACKENKYATEDEIESWIAANGKAAPVFVKGESLEAAAQAAGIDPEGLRNQIDSYNAGIEAGNDEFGRTTKELLEGDIFYIVEQKPRFATTLGGLCINEQMQVLNQDDEPVEGLLAAGEIVGGLHGDDSMPSVCVSWAFVSGRLAGGAAADRVAAGE